LDELFLGQVHELVGGHGEGGVGVGVVEGDQHIVLLEDSQSVILIIVAVVLLVVESLPLSELVRDVGGDGGLGSLEVADTGSGGEEVHGSSEEGHGGEGH